MPPGHETVIIGERREAKAQPQSTFWFGVLGAVVAGFILWLLTTAAGGGVVTGSRFTSDSTRRDREAADVKGTLERIDSRVGAMYCASLPKDKQPGCR